MYARRVKADWTFFQRHHREPIPTLRNDPNLHYKLIRHGDVPKSEQLTINAITMVVYIPKGAFAETMYEQTIVARVLEDEPQDEK